MRHIAAAGMIVAMSVLQGGAAEEALYFSKADRAPLGSTPVVYAPRDEIRLTLTLRASVTNSRDPLPVLAVDGREPSVHIDVMEFRQGVPYLPATVIVEPAGALERDGLDQRLSIRFQLGRSTAFYWIADHFGGIGRISDRHWEGTYRIVASYQRLQSPPIFVTIR